MQRNADVEVCKNTTEIKKRTDDLVVVWEFVRLQVIEFIFNAKEKLSDSVGPGHN